MVDSELARSSSKSETVSACPLQAAEQGRTSSSQPFMLRPNHHIAEPMIACTGMIQLLRRPMEGQKQASTIGDQRSLREYGYVEREKRASWE